ncbi:TOPRIM nucleotidyl transferase/hydrolase domain-containing protein [Streptomyces beijiangensis]|uniref:ATP-dependent endonuclease n=1 Tax=Streptomyces beijiangensis TaxID=163361 RepID=A0A939F5F1_9ACTN|nr:TOPRIM nucleotidyl transferase/hydrolase domain-containing protein [Streptomyces beijiangensis]MBO0512916.1 ATP-dependent endonuclease [Streptomyces beijiangensis]
MDQTTRFSRAAVAWAAGGADAEAAAAAAQELAATADLRTVVLVEGVSDLAAVQALAARQNRNLDDEAIAVVPLGGATSITRFLNLFGPQGLDIALAGLCDAGEERYFRRALTEAGVEPQGFYVCDADLEDELIRALGAPAVEQVITEQGELRQLRTFQKQPAQRDRTPEQQLRRFMGTHSGRKAQYAHALVDALSLTHVPRPLQSLLAYV